MVPSSPTTLFEASIPSSSLRPFSRILVSLSKIGDELSFEASSSKVSWPLQHALIQVMLSALSLSKAAFGMITLEGNTFFTSYTCPDPERSNGIVVHCKMQIRVLSQTKSTHNSSSSVSSKRETLKPARIKIRV